MVTRRVMGTGLVLMLCAGAWADGPAKMPFTLSKETTGIVAPVRADGRPDYVAAMNAEMSAGVTPKNNGFVKWLEAVGTKQLMSPQVLEKTLALCGAKPQEGTGTELNYYSYLGSTAKLKGHGKTVAENELADARRAFWSEGYFPHAAAYLKAMEKTLSLASEAAARPKWWCPAVGDSMPEVLLPSLGSERAVGEAFCARATLRAKAGDFAGFLADVVAARRLARHAAGFCTIERLAAASMEANACEAVGTVVGSGTLTAAQCADVDKAMAEFGPLPSAWSSVDQCERWIRFDTVEMVALGEDRVVKMIVADPDQPDLSRNRAWSIDRSAVDWDQVLKQVNTLTDQQVAAMQMADVNKMREALNAFDDARKAAEAAAVAGRPALAPLRKKRGEGRDAYSMAVADGLFQVAFGPLRGAAERVRAANLQGEMVRTLIAAARVKAEKGKWPATLEGAGIAVPGDLYAEEGQAGVRWVVGGAGGAGARVYSLGPNGTDDGGVDERNHGMDDLGVGVWMKAGDVP